MRLLLALVSLCALACGPTDSFGEAESDLVGGTPAWDDDAVVALVRAGVAYCTGTLVSETVVVTAAHCIDDEPIAEVGVYFGANAASPASGDMLRVTEAVVHPLYAEDDSYDLALLRLRHAAPVAPARLVDRRLNTSILGKPMRLVGFGQESLAGPSGRKNEGSARVTALGAHELTHSPAPTATCKGDSGGPGFMTFGGREMLVSVHARGSCGGPSTKVRLDVFVDDFIAPFLAEGGE